MTPAEFKRSLSNTKPPCDVSTALAGLWWAGRDDWNKAHELVMDDAGADCAWVHAYLHRVEGDLANARYWYSQAGRPPATAEFAEEWAAMAATLLRASS